MQAAWLVVGDGEPYLRGSRINLGESTYILGRKSESFNPEIAFSNFLISRRHCLIRRRGENFIISDLGSKHGTEVNGQALLANCERELAHGDAISLAKGAVTLRMVASSGWDETMELGRMRKPQAEALFLDEIRRECKVDGEVVLISAKEWDFLWLLYQNPGRLVGYDDIKRTVWGERSVVSSARQVPDVGMDEINTLIYRLRRKLGNSGELIRTVRGQGCLLEKALPETPIS